MKTSYEIIYELYNKGYSKKMLVKEYENYCKVLGEGIIDHKLAVQIIEKWLYGFNKGGKNV